MEHDHLPALSALLLAAPLAVLAVAAAQRSAALRRRMSRATPTDQLVSLLLFITGAIHLGLVPGHMGDRLWAISFLATGVGLTALAIAALLLSELRWGPVAAAATAAVLAGYVLTRLAGLESVDALGVATACIELAILGALAAGTRRPALLQARR